MRLILILLFATTTTLLPAQSKKALQAEVNSLKAQLEELKKPKEVSLTTEMEKASYALGVLLSTNVKSQAGDSINLEAITAAFKDVFQNNTLKIDQQQAMMIFQEYMQKSMDAKSSKAREESTRFLDQNKKAEGVQVTPSGLQYKVIKQGTGKKPGANDRVTVHYTGKLINGEIFDSSVERGEPATFGVGQVIPGWTEALQLMNEGSKYLLFIPENLAYGERGAGGQIPPYAALIFEVELLKVN